MKHEMMIIAFWDVTFCVQFERRTKILEGRWNEPVRLHSVLSQKRVFLTTLAVGASDFTQHSV
jgi:hypothetical protein